MLVSNKSEWHTPWIMWGCKEGTACLRSMSVDQVLETSNTLGIWHDLKVSSEHRLHYVSSSVLVIKSTQITTGVVWFLTFHVTLFDRHCSLNNLHIGEEIRKTLLGKKKNQGVHFYQFFPTITSIMICYTGTRIAFKTHEA